MTDAFDWMEYLRLAHQLATIPADEAAQRSAISRAYYCAYHRTTIVCQEKTNLLLRGHRIWNELEEFGRNNDRAILRMIGERGKHLKQRRVLADYHNPYNRDDRRLPPLEHLAADSINHAQTILRLLDRI